MCVAFWARACGRAVLGTAPHSLGGPPAWRRRPRVPSRGRVGAGRPRARRRRHGPRRGAAARGAAGAPAPRARCGDVGKAFQRRRQRQPPTCRPAAPPPPTSSPLHAALGLSLDATPADARAAFRRVAAACHPDVDASEEAAASLASAAAAAAVLSRPAAAARYAEGGLAAVPDAERAFGREGKKKGGRVPRAAPTPHPSRATT